ncbi:D-alanyl-D-alanine carboxypeptidase/D-alanyl-D-alanine endopeptidase [Streptacidiphilus rugosus]|uniref:D-alanyl-D-alanine carboxypeptidase/D-alanyl-D-alanine endopeptidase n=1 Tax=Streptacidiphilus rugosus TaxID=405783 RepID=UPI00068CA1C9|nr:D-alanyl-D-alanine carboxypeptidase/D-alanyl-D-alanine-endopeptidase [Streptacidiphilus rugosus]
MRGRLRPALASAREAVRTASTAAWTAAAPTAKKAGRRYAYAPTRWVAGIAAGTGLVLAVVSIAVAGPWQGGQRTSERALAAGRGHVAGHPGGAAGSPAKPAGPSWQAPAAVLTPAGVTATAPTRSGLAGALTGPLADRALGRVTASVVDVADGSTLYSSGADQPQQPASTNKIATATAALALLGPDHRFTTKVVGDGHGGLVLVGGGDPTLTSSGGSGSDSLSALAAATVQALNGPSATAATGGKADAADAAATASTDAPATTGAPVSPSARPRVTYDISLFAGPALHPIGVNGNIALVQALTADEGRIDRQSTEDAPRYADPAATAARTFVQALNAAGLHVAGSGTPVQATAPVGAKVVAEVQSAPLSEIVERMLTESDNDIAEALGHACAIAAGRPATFAGGADAVRATLTRLGVSLGATRLVDSSGLSGQDGIPARVLTQLLVLDASPAHPELRAVLSGLPIAGFTGTLDNRYGGEGSAAGLGVVRAKTGSLSTVNTLAGLVVDRSGRLLAFAFMSNGSADATSARAALDRLAAKVATCGCAA